MVKKQTKKVFLAALTMLLLCITSVPVLASDTILGIPADQYGASLSTSLEDDYLKLGYDKLKFYEENYTGYRQLAYGSLAALKENIGDYVSTDTSHVEFLDDDDSDNKVTVRLKSKFSKADIYSTVTIQIFNGDEQPSITAIEFSQYNNENVNMGEKMGKAALNTLMGMGTVFLVLIFISFLISLFRFLPGKAGKKPSVPAPAVSGAVPVPAAVPESEDSGNLIDDGELVAVITAAIAASQQTSTSGFVVRSIRKRR